jgi:hypothetical protein
MHPRKTKNVQKAFIKQPLKRPSINSPQENRVKLKRMLPPSTTPSKCAF